MATNYDFLNLPKSKPGSSTAYGESLLAGKIKRSEKRAEEEEKFSKWLVGVKTGVKGAKWWMDEKIDDFHRGNSAVYANLQGLLNSSSNILTQNQEIIKTGKSFEDYFYGTAYNNIVEEYTRGGKQPIGDAELQRIAREKAKLMAVEWTGLVKSAQAVPTNIEDYKEQARINQNIPNSPAGWVRNKLKGSLKGETTETIDAKSKQITLDIIQGPLFDNVRSFRKQLEIWNASGTSEEQKLVTEITAAVNEAGKAIASTSFSRTETKQVRDNDPDSPTFGQLVQRGIRFTDITYTDGSTMEKQNVYTIGKNDPPPELDAAVIRAVEETFNSKGTKEFYEAWGDRSAEDILKGNTLDNIMAQVGGNISNLQVDTDEVSADNLRYKTLEALVQDLMSRAYDPSNPADKEKMANELWNSYQAVNLLGDLVQNEGATREEFTEAVYSVLDLQKLP